MPSKRPPARIYFATGNLHKYREVSTLFQEHGLSLLHLPLSPPEIQSDRLEEIALYGVRELSRRYRRAVFKEDAGLFIDALKGFPGPYSSFVYRTIGRKGVLRLMEGEEDRGARFISAVAYYEPSIQPLTFTGEVKGEISRVERGSGGFAFDPIFIPYEGDGRTFAEMSLEEKNRISHRRRAVEKLIQWLKDRWKR